VGVSNPKLQLKICARLEQDFIEKSLVGRGDDMKGQWGLILALIFALIVAIFAVINVDSVQVNYLFGTAEWPLVLVILGSVLVGGLIIGGFGIYRVFRQRREIRALTKENAHLKAENEKSAEPTPSENALLESEEKKEQRQETAPSVQKDS
jgi:putative membrane protein